MTVTRVMQERMACMQVLGLAVIRVVKILRTERSFLAHTRIIHLPTLLGRPLMNHTRRRSKQSSPFRSFLARTVLASLALVCAAKTSVAQESPRSLLGLGVISLPEFEGSSDQAMRPFLVGRVDYGDYGSLRLTGVTAQYNLLTGKSRWAFGPLLALRPARDKDVEDPVVRKLREIDSTTEAGLFVEYGFTDALSKGDRLSLGLETRSGKGSQLSWVANYQWEKTGAFQYGVDLRATYANDKHMDTYFSVDADNSARSGLPRYAASAGLKSTALGLNVTYDINRQWALIGRLAFSRLAGDAKDSPIVQLRGDSNATSVGLALGYRF
jgi:outer membrane protein